MNKYILLILIVFFLFQNIKAQSVECDTHFEAKDTVYLPHFGQNQKFPVHNTPFLYHSLKHKL